MEHLMLNLISKVTLKVLVDKLIKELFNKHPLKPLQLSNSELVM